MSAEGLLRPKAVVRSRKRAKARSSLPPTLAMPSPAPSRPGQSTGATHWLDARPRSRRGQSTGATHGGSAAPASSFSGASPRVPTSTPLPPGEPAIRLADVLLEDVIAEIREQHRMRTDYHSAEKRLTNQIKAIERRTAKASGGRNGHDNQRSTAAQGEAGDEPLQISSLVSVHLVDCRAQIEAHRKEHEKRVGVLAQRLSAWSWVEAQRGFGALGLGQIVGEAGNLSDLWRAWRA